MTVEHIAMVYAAGGMTASEKHLLGAYCNHTDAHGYCWPSVERLADETGMSVRTVQRTNALLRQKGLIKSVRRTNPKTGLQITNLTRVNLAKLAEMRRRPDRDYGDNLVEEITFDDKPVDDSFSQVREGRQSVTPRGDNLTGRGRQSVTPRGDTVTPETSLEPSVEPSSSSSSPPPPAPAREPEPCQEQEEATTMETALSVVDAAAAMWGGHRLPTPSERLKLAERAAQAIAKGARRADVVHALSRDLSDARSAVAVVMARTKDDGWWRNEVAPAAVTPAPRPKWCGVCDERTRQREDAQGRPYRCPECHPLRDITRQDDAEVISLEASSADDGDVIDLRAYR